MRPFSLVKAALKSGVGFLQGGARKLPPECFVRSLHGLAVHFGVVWSWVIFCGVGGMVSPLVGGGEMVCFLLKWFGACAGAVLGLGVGVWGCSGMIVPWAVCGGPWGQGL